MEMELSDLGNDVVKVMLSGRLDTAGVGRIETRFTAALVPLGRNVIVDLSRVEYIASMGIRMFLQVARSLKQNQAKLALYAPQQLVNNVFEAAHLRYVMLICADAEEASAAVRTSA